MARRTFLRASSSDSSTASSASSSITVANMRMGSSAAASLTPPTSRDDTASSNGDAPKAALAVAGVEAPVTKGEGVKESLEHTQDADANERTTTRRSSTRSRHSIATYNVKVLAGTARHTPTKHTLPSKHVATGSRTVSGETLVNGTADTSTNTSIDLPTRRVLGDGIKALDLDWRVGSMSGDDKAEPKQSGGLQRRKSTRLDLLTAAVTNAASTLGKRGREAVESGKDKLGSLRRRQSLRPRFKEAQEKDEEPPQKRTRMFPNLKVAEESGSEEEPKTVSQPETKSVSNPTRKPTKTWLAHGLYLGQEPDFDPRLTETKNKLKRASKGRAVTKKTALPLPMYTKWQRERDFCLPFDVFAPLPPGQPKPDEWKKTSKNRFVGDSATEWKTNKIKEVSWCTCRAITHSNGTTTGCGDDCHNRIMNYECDEGNCNLGAEVCTNRAFADLKERCRHGNKYDIGVEVMHTGDRGYGVRANRTFEPGQIIVEYAGEIITLEESDRRMNEEYKNNECYYLMAFEQDMIIDATRGSIARFVNHSCEPNCEMVKWRVDGKPRMALFAGEKGIMTGAELTYDYNFDPYSQKNIQQCRCGTASCRGVLGPKQKDAPKSKSESAVVGMKRKLAQVFGSSDSNPRERKLLKKQRVTSIAKSALTRTKRELVTPAPAPAKRTDEKKPDARATRLLRRSLDTLASASGLAPASTRASAAASTTTLTSRSGRAVVSKRSASTIASSTSLAGPAPLPTRRASTLGRFTSALKEQALTVKKSVRRSTLPAASAVESRNNIDKPKTTTKMTTRQSLLSFTPPTLDLDVPRQTTKGPDNVMPAPTPSFARELLALRRPATAASPRTRTGTGAGSQSQRPTTPASATTRPTTASSARSVATSVKAGIVRSVRGTRRAAAVARYGLLQVGEEGSGSSIRVVLGEE
ncbi:hypothetical protein B0A49_05848 [Cryomyces minteri]|uniref:Histone-lysine N-methyltransferase ASH1L n=1 Tax=Cryomyces minteri TaxID=331657 RepID=A0A4U0X5Z4_9PEZI|nr:hypothetical protein B0A49_05848 [Cryomyces minteri]